MNEEAKIKSLPFNQADFKCPATADSLTRDTLDTIRLMKEIQHTNGEKGCQRFIISNCQQASDILQLIACFYGAAGKKIN
jgi:phosphoenolpyruvate carboxylase